MITQKKIGMITFLNKALEFIATKIHLIVAFTVGTLYIPYYWYREMYHYTAFDMIKVIFFTNVTPPIILLALALLGKKYQTFKYVVLLLKETNQSRIMQILLYLAFLLVFLLLYY